MSIDVPYLRKEAIEAEAALVIAEYGRDHGQVTEAPVPIDEIAELVLEQFEGRYLLVATGAPELRTAVIDHLPKEVQAHIGGGFTVEVHAGIRDVSAAAEPAQRGRQQEDRVVSGVGGDGGA